MSRKSVPSMSAQDRRWQAEDDFRTLTSSEEIQADKRRLTRARRAGKRLVKDAKKALTRQQRVASGR
jgi:hypothetical protein